MNEFLPTDLAGILGLVVQSFVVIVAVVTYVLRYVRKPLEEAQQIRKEQVDDKFRLHGERIGAVEVEIKEVHTMHGGLDRQVERLELRVVGMAEQHGRLEERLGQLARTLETYHEQRLAEDRVMSERLARMEVKMEIFGTLNETLSKLSAKL